MAPTKESAKDNKDVLENLNRKSNKFLERTRKSPKSRWKLLARAIKGNEIVEIKDDKNENDQDRSLTKSNVLRYPSYNLLQCNKLTDSSCTKSFCPSIGDKEDTQPNIYETGHCAWFKVSAEDYKEINLKISCISPKFSIKEINGFNNTGNVCIWPAEECLSIFCLENRSIFDGKSVIELGAGMAGLAGLIVAQACNATDVTLTDGNENSVNNLNVIIPENQFKASVTAQKLEWSNKEFDKTSRQYDIAICADCLFFDEGRTQLMSTLAKVLKHSGLAILVAPSRSGTFDDFVHLINNETESFNQVKKNCQYSKQIWLRRQQLISCDGSNFDEDKDYPIMMMFTRK